MSKSYAGFLAYRIKMDTEDFQVTEISDLPLIRASGRSEANQKKASNSGENSEPSSRSSKSRTEKKGSGKRERAEPETSKEVRGEQNSRRQANSGLNSKTYPFAVYSLEKDGWNTVDAIQRVAARFRIPAKNIHYGGKKDRHARTIQWITVKNGPDISHQESGYTIQHLGASDSPMGPERIQGNRFRLVVRNILEREIPQIEAGLIRLKERGFPNYFDDQRFGSFHPLIGFPFLSLFRGDPESALRYTLLSAFGGDKPHAKRRKKAINDCWGNWDAALKLASTKTESAILGELKKARLVSGDDSDQSKEQFTTLLNRLPKEDLSMSFSAVQSWIFNESIARLFRSFSQQTKRGKGPDQKFTGDFTSVEIKTKTGDQCFPVSFPLPVITLFRSTVLELIGPGRQTGGDDLSSAGTAPEEIIRAFSDFPEKSEASAETERLLQRAFLSCETQVKEILEIPDAAFQKDFLDRAFLKSHRRPLWCLPEEMTWSDFSGDEKNKNKLKYTVEFSLPRGTYATMAMKMLHLRLKQ